MTKLRRVSTPSYWLAALLAMVLLGALGVQPASAAVSSFHPVYWDDGHVRVNVSIELNAFENPGSGEPALIRYGKDLGYSTPAEAYKYCTAHSASAGYYRTHQCMRDASNSLKADLAQLERYLGPLTRCEAPVGRRLLQNRHSLAVAFASATAFYGYSVASGYAGHYLPYLAGPHVTIQVQAGLLAVVVIAVHFINVLASRTPALPELLSVVGSWFAHSVVSAATGALRDNVRETLAAYFAQHPAQRASCTSLANMV